MVSEDDIWRWLHMLSSAVTPVDVGVAVVEVGPDAADASFASLAMRDPHSDWVQMVRGSALDPTIAARWSEFPLSTSVPLYHAIQTAQPVLLGSARAISARYPSVVADTSAALLKAMASLPLHAASGAVLGAVGFGWPRPQAFKADQLRRLDLLAGLIAQALDRALLHQREQERAAAPPAPTKRSSGPAPDLTPRERAVLQLLAGGYTNNEMASLLGVSLRTVESSRAGLRQHLGLNTRAQLVRFATQAGIIDPNLGMGPAQHPDPAVRRPRARPRQA